MIQAVIFDLDGVIVSTDEFHFLAWQQLAQEKEIPFSREDNEKLKGVSRMESLEIILQGSPKTFSDQAKEQMAERKNSFYRDMLKKLTPADVLPGVLRFLQDLRTRKIRAAIGSSSKNAVPILGAIGLADAFEAVADGTQLSISDMRLQIENLHAQLALARSAATMRARAESMGFSPVQSDQIVYLPVPGYVERQTVVLAPPMNRPVQSAPFIPAEYTESLFTWARRHVAAAYQLYARPAAAK